MPGQKSSGKNGARVVSVPARTGIQTSPAAIRADMVAESLPLLSTNILCVFSITTIASSTIIPRPNNRANNTIKFRVMLEPVINSAAGKNINATNMLNGTDNATKNALVRPIKNIRINSTSTKPITIEFTRSLNEVRVALLRSPVITTSRFLGNLVCFKSSTTFLISSEVSIKFSPARFIMFSVTTFLPFKRA